MFKIAIENCGLSWGECTSLVDSRVNFAASLTPYSHFSRISGSLAKLSPRCSQKLRSRIVVEEFNHLEELTPCLGVLNSVVKLDPLNSNSVQDTAPDVMVLFESSAWEDLESRNFTIPRLFEKINFLKKKLHVRPIRDTCSPVEFPSRNSALHLEG